MVAPVDVIALDGIGEALGEEDDLIHLQTIGVQVICFRQIEMRRGAEVE